MTARWEYVQQFIDDENTPTEFTNRNYAAYWQTTREDASLDIQSYLNAQRSKRIKTKHMLSRIPNTRTNNSRWKADRKASAARRRIKTLESDSSVTIKNAFADLKRTAALNPLQVNIIDREIDIFVREMSERIATMAEVNRTQ